MGILMIMKIYEDISILYIQLKFIVLIIPHNIFNVLIDITRADFIDKDIIDTINEFIAHAHLKNIRVEIKKSSYKALHELVQNTALNLSDTVH